MEHHGIIILDREAAEDRAIFRTNAVTKVTDRGGLNC